MKSRPSAMSGTAFLKYREHHLEFVMSQKRTVQFINISDSYEHQLRFEWQLPTK